jgi:hypothetical protein
MRPPFDLSKLRQTGIKRGFVDAARRTATPHIVSQNGLCEDQFGQQRYCEEREQRRRWIIEHCRHQHEVEPIRDTRMRLTGFLFRFADADEAFAFRMRF